MESGIRKKSRAPLERHDPCLWAAMSEPIPSERAVAPFAPLILTLSLDDASQAALDALRRANFPAERNHLRAHLTLFHKLPGDELERVTADLDEVAGAFRPVAMIATKPIALGRGVAIAFDAPGLHTVRAELRRRWDAWLAPQDRQRHRPHVTVQNKVTPSEARALHAELSASFAPFPATGIGLALWRYLGGPWEHVAAFPFNEAPSYVDPLFPDEPIF